MSQYTCDPVPRKRLKSRAMDSNVRLRGLARAIPDCFLTNHNARASAQIAASAGVVWGMRTRCGDDTAVHLVRSVQWFGVGRHGGLPRRHSYPDPTARKKRSGATRRFVGCNETQRCSTRSRRPRVLRAGGDAAGAVPKPRRDRRPRTGFRHTRQTRPVSAPP